MIKKKKQNTPNHMQHTVRRRDPKGIGSEAEGTLQFHQTGKTKIRAIGEHVHTGTEPDEVDWQSL